MPASTSVCVRSWVLIESSRLLACFQAERRSSFEIGWDNGMIRLLRMAGSNPKGKPDHGRQFECGIFGESQNLGKQPLPPEKRRGHCGNEVSHPFSVDGILPCRPCIPWAIMVGSH
jgi:hypothetical protein